MAKYRYNRSEVFSFEELTKSQQRDAVSNQGRKLAKETSYVLFDEMNGKQSALPLNMFMRDNFRGCNPCPRWDGTYGLSYDCAYRIKFSRCGSMAVVAYQWS